MRSPNHESRTHALCHGRGQVDVDNLTVGNQSSGSITQKFYRWLWAATTSGGWAHGMDMKAHFGSGVQRGLRCLILSDTTKCFLTSDRGEGTQAPTDCEHSGILLLFHQLQAEADDSGGGSPSVAAALHSTRPSLHSRSKVVSNCTVKAIIVPLFLKIRPKPAEKRAQN
jgi:hypothetical protein